MNPYGYGQPIAPMGDFGQYSGTGGSTEDIPGEYQGAGEGTGE